MIWATWLASSGVMPLSFACKAAAKAGVPYRTTANKMAANRFTGYCWGMLLRALSIFSCSYSFWAASFLCAARSVCRLLITSRISFRSKPFHGLLLGYVVAGLVDFFLFVFLLGGFIPLRGPQRLPVVDHFAHLVQRPGLACLLGVAQAGAVQHGPVVGQRGVKQLVLQLDVARVLAGLLRG